MSSEHLTIESVTDYPYNYPLLQFRKVDGDTVGCVVDSGFDGRIEKNFRLEGIDTPELRIMRQKPAALVAAAFAIQWVQHATELSPRKLQVLSEKKEKYGRPLGDIVAYINGKDRTLTSFLVSTGVAKLYSGGVREWTDEELAVIEAKQYAFPEYI